VRAKRFEDKTAVDNLTPPKILKERITQLIEAVGLGADADRRAGKFIGGMVRRVSPAMALIHDSVVAFLDEPTVSMDPQSARAVNVIGSAGSRLFFHGWVFPSLQ